MPGKPPVKEAIRPVIMAEQTDEGVRPGQWIMHFLIKYDVVLKPNELCLFETITNRLNRLGTSQSDLEEETSPNSPPSPSKRETLEKKQTQFLYSQIEKNLQLLRAMEKRAITLEEKNVHLRQKSNEVSNLLHMREIPECITQFHTSLQAHICPDRRLLAKKMITAPRRRERTI
jgi:hypothetical protein